MRAHLAAHRIDGCLRAGRVASPNLGYVLWSSPTTTDNPVTMLKLQRLGWSPQRQTLVLQLLRYGIAGLVLTLGNAASYWALTDLGGWDPMISLAFTSAVFLMIGFNTHARFSFKSPNDGGGNGSRGHLGVQSPRFVLVRVLGLCLNQLFVLLLVKHLGGPTWWPIMPMLFVTPFVVFGLLRRFVY